MFPLCFPRWNGASGVKWRKGQWIRFREAFACAHTESRLTFEMSRPLWVAGDGLPPELHYALFELRCKTITSLTFYIHHSAPVPVRRQIAAKILSSRLFIGRFHAERRSHRSSIDCKRETNEWAAKVFEMNNSDRSSAGSPAELICSLRAMKPWSEKSHKVADATTSQVDANHDIWD